MFFVIIIHFVTGVCGRNLFKNLPFKVIHDCYLGGGGEGGGGFSQQLLRQILYYTPLFYKHKAYKHRSLIDRGVEQQGGWGCGIAGWLEKILKTKLSRGREGWVGIVGGWKKLKILIARLCGGVEGGGGRVTFKLVFTFLF